MISRIRIDFTRRRWPAGVAALTLALGAGLVATGCGDDGEEGGGTVAEGTAPAPPANEFPEPKGQTIEEFAAEIGLTNDYAAAPAGSVYTPGTDRFAFAMFNVDGSQLDNADVAVYASADGGPVKGPYPAAIESLETDAPFTAQSTADDPDTAHIVYVAKVPFDKPGNRNMIAVIRNASTGPVATTFSGPVNVAEHPEIPDVGQSVPKVDTPTVDSVGGDIESIDTRIPPDSMHDTDLADVLGKKPVVLVFATPEFCQVRVCGPVVDIAEQVKADHGDEVAFIHMEIFVEEGPPTTREQVDAFGLTTEPWLFVIDRDGRVSTRIEGAYSVDELEQAVEAVV